MSEELKPCPFCGKKPKPYWTDESYIECTNRKCDIYSFGMSTGAWNTRPIEDALNARIAELERDVKWREESISTIEHALANNEDDIEELEAENIRLGIEYQRMRLALGDIAINSKRALKESPTDHLTAHSDIERQDDKSSNDTQTSTIVYGKVCEE